MTSIDALDMMDNSFPGPGSPEPQISPARVTSLCNNNNHSRHSSTTSDDFSESPSPGTPKKTLANREHVKLRLTRSYDPNLTRHRLTAPEPGITANEKHQNHTHASDLLKEREAAHAKLRTVKSFEDSHGVLAHHGPDSPNVSSPRLRKKQTYFKKMAIFFHHGPRSPSATSSPLHSEDESHSDTEFGFDVSPLASPTVMHKGKSPLSPSSRLIPKKWRLKSSSPKLGTSTLWSHEGNCKWTSMSGRSVQLTKTLLVYLSEMERTMLQKVAMQCLQEYELGSITVPKDGALKRSKKSNFSLKGRTKNTSFLDNLKDNFKDIGKENKDPGHSGLVFGIPIARCILNDIGLQRRRSSQRKERRESLDLANTVYRIKPAGKGAGAKNNSKDGGKKQIVEAESEKSSPNASLLEALSLSTSSSDCHRKEKRKALMEREPQVPHVVTSCFKYIENHGLRVLGIFRVGGSKKRIKQLREEFDSGSDVRFHEGYNPHDVAALLKEYFRDLPEPLLSRELYPAFIATSNIENAEKRVRVLHYLVCLLPLTYADTLYVLMKFLSKVASSAKDSIDADGNESPGNKMDSHNLATLFGPNILHKLKSDKGKEFHGDGSSESVEESREVIEIVKSLIDHHEEIFQVNADNHNEVIKLILESDVEALDFILNRISAVQMGYRQSTSDSSVWEGSDISSSMPPTPNSDIQQKTSCDGIQHHTSASTYQGSVPTSPRTSPKSPTAASLPTQHQHQHIKSVSFVRANDREDSSADVQARLLSQTASMGVKKKKIPPPRLNLSKMSANPVGDAGLGGIHSPPISPLALPSYQEHMDCRKKVASPTEIGRQNNNQIKTVSPSSSGSSPPKSGRMIINAAPLSANSYSKSPPIDPWENLYVKRTANVSSKGQCLEEHRNDRNGAKPEVASPQSGKEHGLHDWQREQWLQWQKVATENSTTGDMYEQETLV
ncbi:uncharacterized protein LOC144439232 [Glandiceps talaboti]